MDLNNVINEIHDELASAASVLEELKQYMYELEEIVIALEQIRIPSLGAERAKLSRSKLNDCP